MTLLSEGLLLYSGAVATLPRWFAARGFAYRPEVHVVVTDWVLDLVAIGFDKSAAVEAAGASESCSQRLQVGTVLFTCVVLLCEFKLLMSIMVRNSV